MQSMERSTQLQLRWQTLVESLSIIAAAYYLVVPIIYGLVHVLRNRVLMETVPDNLGVSNH